MTMTANRRRVAIRMVLVAFAALASPGCLVLSLHPA